MAHRRVDEQLPIISVDYAPNISVDDGFLGTPDHLHTEHPILAVVHHLLRLSLRQHRSKAMRSPMASLRKVREVDGLVRTPGEDVPLHAGTELPWKRSIMALVEHGHSFSRGRDGMTPYSRCKGRPWGLALAPSGQSVALRKRTRHKLEAR